MTLRPHVMFTATLSDHAYQFVELVFSRQPYWKSPLSHPSRLVDYTKN